MKLHNYVAAKKELYNLLLAFIENDSDDADDYQILLQFLKTYKYEDSKEELGHILRLILNLFNNYHRHAEFINKIEKLLLFFAEDIKQTLSNTEIFNFFESNKLLILLLIKNDILKFDESINQIIMQKYDEDDPQFCHFFLPEIEKFNDKEKIDRIKNEIIKTDPDVLDDYVNKRSKGENDSYISTLIQKDSIIEFISHINYMHLPLSSTIKPSIYETNPFLIDKNPTLIEYAAFFGSIQIFQYLKMNNVELTSSLWLYAIHSKNANLIHLLEENHIEPNDSSYEKCFLESIKCHHNDISKYIEDNLLNKRYFDDLQFSERIVECSFRNCNYTYFPCRFDISFIFYYLGKYYFHTLVDLLLKARLKNIIEEIIIKSFFLIMKKFHFIHFKRNFHLYI